MPSTLPNPLHAGLTALAVLLPTLLAYNVTPAATVFNQLLALGGWGLLLLWGGGAGNPWSPPPMAARLLQAALALIGIAVLASVWQQRSTQELSALGLLLAAAAVLMLGARSKASMREALGFGLALGALLAALAGVAIGCVQVFAPHWADGQWLARSGVIGRAVGNVRQPNHLATLLLMGSVGLIWLAQRQRTAFLPALLLMGLLVFGVLLSASRTGLWLGIPLLVAWGLLDRQLDRRWRLLLLLTPLLAALAWWGLSLWAHSGAGVFGAEARLDSEGAGSPSRLKILANAWQLLLQQPWTGVGYGEFNRAWTLTPFPERPTAFFDHTHNLPLQLLVELGLPLGLLVLGLLLAGLLLTLRDAIHAQGESAVLQRAPLVMALVVGTHSLLEYPLWYGYFLLPTALALGLAMRPREASAVGLLRRPGPAAIGVLLIAGSLYALWEYRAVAAIYAPAPISSPLQERIARGQRTLLFSAQADYAAATATGANLPALQAAQRTGHQLIDVRLMMAWARSLHAVGETDKARFVVARLREFRSREGTAWLKECESDPSLWMCAPPQRHYDWREF